MEVNPEVWVNVFLAVLLVVLTAVFFRTSNGSTKGSTATANTTPKPMKPAAAAAKAATPAPRPKPTEEQPRGAVEAKSSGPSKEEPPAASAPKGALSASSAAAATKDKSPEAYSGVVKRYSERNGMGFISCGPLKERHGVDVRVFREEVEAEGRPRLQVGDAVRFHVVLGGRALCRADHPWATEVTVLGTSSPGPEDGPSPPPPTAAASPPGDGLGAEAPEDPAPSPSRSRLDPTAAAFVMGGTAPERPRSGSQLNAGAAEFVPGALGTGTFQ